MGVRRKLSHLYVRELTGGAAGHVVNHGIRGEASTGGDQNEEGHEGEKGEGGKRRTEALPN